MENVTVKKTEALEILKRNRDQHRKIFLEAVDGYKKQAIEMLEKHIIDIRKGKVQNVVVSLPKPEDHTKDYDRAIRMLEMSVDVNVVMDEHSFGSYIMDDWSWKRQFLTANSAYSVTASNFLSES